VDLEQKNLIVKSFLGLREDGDESKKPIAYEMAIAYWIVLCATGEQLLPMLVVTSVILHIEGYDYDPNTGVDPAVLAKQLLFLYSEWSKALTKSIEKEVDSGKKQDPFLTIAVLLYHAQARVWLGSYDRRGLFCRTCFLQRERYINDVEDIFYSMPASICS
jgi:hypothetical protein